MTHSSHVDVVVQCDDVYRTDVDAKGRRRRRTILECVSRVIVHVCKMVTGTQKWANL